MKNLLKVLLGVLFLAGAGKVMADDDHHNDHASVVIVKPAGTRPAPRTRVISATLAPMPPSRSRISRDPSEKSYTHLCIWRLTSASASFQAPEGDRSSGCDRGGFPAREGLLTS